MSPRRATQRKPEPEAALPEVLIAPGQATDNQREAYWINLLANVDELKAATETTDFFVLCQEFPTAAWDRLTIYLYRLTDDAGMLIKNSDDKPHYIKVLRQPLTEEFVAKNWGGGKYQALLKIDNKEVLRKHTFRIDGDPKVLPGQRVEVEGRVVPLNGAAPPVAPEPRSDTAAVIEASASANRQNMEILAEGSKAAIALVREQASAAAKPDSSNGIVEKLLTVLLEKIAAPPPTPVDPIDSFIKLQTLIQKQNPEPAEAQDPPIEKAMQLVETMSGGKSFSELIKGKGPAAPDSPWAPFAPVALSFVNNLPGMMSEFRQTRMIDAQARDLQFRRDAWLRTAKPGEAIPPELLALPAATPTRQPQAHQPQQPQTVDATAAPNAVELVPHIVQMVCHGFDTNPYNGGETAAAIAFNFGRQIEATGIDELLGDPAQIEAMVQGNPLLQQRSQHAKWPAFQKEFMDYMKDRFGEMAPADDEQVTGPQPVA